MQGRERYQGIVVRFDELIRTNLGKLNHVSDVSAAMGVTQRTLVRAIRTVHGTTPSYRLRMLRLTEARDALMLVKARTETVTDVAMRLGFVQLGRFAADYRGAFGESPSDTLRRAVGGIPAAEAEAANSGPPAGERTICTG
ncbi:MULTISPECIES: helix-turn-helix domain-containing protein [unclassified Bradyrhizobium]|uniref:helix-turn-helix domain-containing protein n=1 Tax=unclassified Bradyrhizobium TaxID=2631580 RepID=UPI0023EEAFF0|nr:MULTISPECIES: helix-turn-helix domain-containing protein [unclassified Bradyrhizobium]MCK1445671.1 AraC family transcriptional regulator [Bradyrhizobium sp. 48]MCK1465379.1 AraC family transcriptional regulator [Bradyrhizobium sp. 2]